MSGEYVLNKPTHLSCPECGGALQKIESDPIPKYACHIGHVLTGEAMLEAQDELIERSLTTALAMLNEHGELCRQMMDDGISDRARLKHIIKAARARAESLRELLNEPASDRPSHAASANQ
jgi:two-component system, chemotaxis family, protein-glutamate methylesterase/glutaminase